MFYMATRAATRTATQKVAAGPANGQQRDTPWDGDQRRRWAVELERSSMEARNTAGVAAFGAFGKAATGGQNSETSSRKSRGSRGSRGRGAGGELLGPPPPPDGPPDGDGEDGEEEDEDEEAVWPAPLRPAPRPQGKGRGPPGAPRWRGGSAPEAPSFDGDVSRDSRAYDKWKKQIEVWKVLVAEYLPPNEQALRLFQRVTGDAADELECLPLADINADDGVDRIVEALRLPFAEHLLVTRTKAISDYEQINRHTGESLREHLVPWA